MTKPSPEYTDFVLEQLAPLGAVQSGRFFGGVGLTSEGTQFAMLMGHSLYLVVNETTRPQYEEMGGTCFWYKTRKGRVNVRKYYEVPAEILDDQDRLIALAQDSIRIAHQEKKRK